MIVVRLMRLVVCIHALVGLGHPLGYNQSWQGPFPSVGKLKRVKSWKLPLDAVVPRD